jgi:hypothetical protein
MSIDSQLRWKALPKSLVDELFRLVQKIGYTKVEILAGISKSSLNIWRWYPRSPPETHNKIKDVIARLQSFEHVKDFGICVIWNYYGRTAYNCKNRFIAR